MKIAIAQINTTIGDFKGNAETMISHLAWARAEGADLAIFPELATCGYPPRDLLEKPLFIRRNLECVDEVAKAARGIGAVIGFASPNENQTGRGLYNAAALVCDGRTLFVQEKSLLPEYDVFDEARHFEPASSRRVFAFRGTTIALSLCEDVWSNYTFEGGRRLYSCDPIREFVDLGAELVINISASPYVVGKPAIREQLNRQAAQRYGKPMVYCNLVGGNDELIFDGQSMVVDAGGEIVWRAKAFEEDRVLIDLGQPRACVQEHAADIEQIRRALVLGIHDYMRKCGFSKAVIGLSGGVDSAVVVNLACEAIGPENVTAVILPSGYTPASSMDDAHGIARALGVKAHVIPIGGIYEAYRTTLGFDKASTGQVSVAEENLQARTRGNILMAISNREGSLVMSTGNKSELAVGYCTLYGDMAGGLAVISDVPKTIVYELARHYHRRGTLPQTVIDKAPSAELKPDQTDQDNLPPYDVLDQILKLYIEDRLGSSAIVERGFDADTVRRVVTMVEHNEYKRRQASPGFKVTSKAFGSGRRFPIARKMYW